MIAELGGTTNENGTINTYNTSGTFVQGIRHCSGINGFAYSPKKYRAAF